MCLIIVPKKGYVLPKEVYKAAYARHDDGFGMAYVENGALVVEKDVCDFDALYARIQAREKDKVMIHFRDAPHMGEKTKEFAHPFLITTSHQTTDGRPRFTFAVTHNGTFAKWYANAKESDTMRFVNEMLKPTFEQDPWFLDTIPGSFFIQRTIGENNKLAIMRYDAETNELETYIVNAHKGERYKGCWFSNDTYKKGLPIVPTAVTVHSSAYASPTINYLFRDQWEKPDALGWSWSFTHDCWYHAQTKATSVCLVHRMLKPSDMLRDQKVIDKKEGKLLKKIAVDWWRSRHPKVREIDGEMCVRALRSFVKAQFTMLLSNKSEYELDRWILDNRYCTTH